MNIIWLELESMLPATTGGRIGSLKRLEQIAKSENIYLFYPYDNENELLEVQALQHLCKEVHPYYRRENRWNALRNLYRFPYTVGSRLFSAMRADIIECIKKNDIDLINIDYPHMCVDLIDMPIRVPIVLNQFNIEWMLYKSISKSSKNILKKLAYGVDSNRLKRFEQRITKKLPLRLVTFLSDKDMAFAIKHGFYDEMICRWVPLGGDVLPEKEENDETNMPAKGSEKIILFTGKMSYSPNDEAAQWFAKGIFPLISKEIKNVKFHIVGKDPTEEVKRLASEQIIVTGYVDDMEPYFKMADLIVLPLRNGGGVKVKLLQAVSHKKPIVSTPIGVEGTEYADGKTIHVTDDRIEFAKACVSILKDPEKAKLRQSQAYDIFIKNYTWEIIGKKYLQMLREAADHR